MSDRGTILVGAVAYHPRIVTIWERFRDYFDEAGVPTDYVLYSNYERLVDALLGGDAHIAWNTNTAYVAAEHRIGGDAQLLGMRDVAPTSYRVRHPPRRGVRGARRVGRGACRARKPRLWSCRDPAVTAAPGGAVPSSALRH